MVFDLDTTYFPQASRDNFGKPFGQNFYNYEWYIGDRTSIVSYGWFEFWKVTGDPYFQNTNVAPERPVRPPHRHLGPLDHPDPQGEHLHRLHDRQHRADLDLGPPGVVQLLDEPEVVRDRRESYDFGTG